MGSLDVSGSFWLVRSQATGDIQLWVTMSGTHHDTGSGVNFNRYSHATVRLHLALNTASLSAYVPLEIVEWGWAPNGFGLYRGEPPGGAPELEQYGNAAVAIEVDEAGDWGRTIAGHHAMAPLLKEGQPAPQ